MEKRKEWQGFVSPAISNAQGEWSLTNLVQHLIDIATEHADSLGIGNPAMAGRGCGWILARLTIEAKRWPHTYENWTLSTWVEDWNRHFSTRCFAVDCEGKRVVEVRSVWMVLDYEARANYGLSHLDLPADMIDGTPVSIARDSRHRPLPVEATVGTYTFRYCDIDFYRHVNTVRYIELLLNQHPMDFMEANRLQRFEIAFMKESVSGSTVFLRRHDDAWSLNDAEGTPLISARISFLPR